MLDEPSKTTGGNMRKLILAMAATLIAAPAFASDTDDVANTVKKYNAVFNKGDVKSFVALCAAQTTIIDDFAPHLWQSANTCTDWADALAAYDKKSGITNEHVTLGAAWHVAVEGDRGYAVYPTHYSYKRNGKSVTEQGVWTFALQKLPDGWRIAAWSWAQH
jgi:ketosteroid isomerase-like protein